MNRRVRSKLEMAQRVREFCRAHPSDDPGYATGIASLEGNLGRAEAIAAREQHGITRSKVARSRRREIRNAIHSQILYYLMKVVDRAVGERPDLVEAIQLPSHSLSYREYAVAVRGILAAAAPEKELLIRLGMSPGLLDQLERMVEDLEAASEIARTSRRDHMGARIDFDVVCDELFKDVRLLGGIYQWKFGSDPQLMAEWEVVRHVPGLPRPKLTVEEGGAIEPPKEGTGQDGSSRVA